MFSHSRHSRSERRGIVLVVILGMLGLMALIGVTFATFSGQSLINNRNFSQSVNLPSPEQLMDYALSQLINDTNNPTSALRGHSLLRDMYGSDSLLGNSAAIRGFLGSRPDGIALQLINSGAYPTLAVSGPNPGVNLSGFTQYETNLPIDVWPQLYNIDFTRWVLRTLPRTVTDPGTGVTSVYPSQTLEVLHDARSVNGNHVLTLAPADNVTRLYNSPNLQYMYGVPAPNNGTGPTKSPVFMAQLTGSAFVLDCRYMRAQNGPGASHFNAAGVPFNSAAYGNYRVNGELLSYPFGTQNFNSYLNLSRGLPTLGNPDQFGLDEDYDACDLENWFLAIQSADGQVMIPSFHRPGILTANDWVNSLNSTSTSVRQSAILSTAKILRPRAVDQSAGFPADPSAPDPLTGQMKYDVDNDGDGVSDSVWLDLGYPVMKDSRGKTFKPLFAFMVLGLNGRLPLNTVGNLHGRDMNPPTGGDLPIFDQPDAMGNVLLSYPDRPTWTHASHLGYSVNEINPIFALQNACDAVTTNNTSPNPSLPSQWLWQADNAGFDVGTTQLRNLLAGTIPSTELTPASGTSYNDPTHQEKNFVGIQGSPWFLPNSLYDPFERNFYGVAQSQITRTNAAVPGRWGEPEGVPRVLVAPTIVGHTAKSTTATPILTTIQAYENPVRAGRSFLNSTGQSADVFDDDFDTTDPAAQMPAGGDPFSVDPFNPIKEAANLYDPTGSNVLPVERIRRFVKPIDPIGIGRVAAYNARPKGVLDYGTAADDFGRSAYFRYFRPPGIPQVISYDLDPMHSVPATLPASGGINTPVNERYNIPIFLLPTRPDATNNLYHGFWSHMFPRGGILGGGPEGVAVAGSAPFDLDPVNSTAAAAFKFAPFGAGSSAMPAPIAYQTMPTAFPSISSDINSSQGPYLGPGSASRNLGSKVINGYPNYPPLLPSNSNLANVGSSLNKDEADELNLYSPGGTIDMPYGPSDLEWLYRKQDVDGTQLDSRLGRLAPISFLNPVDGLMRRRLFSIESWDLNTSVFSYDNPTGSYLYNSKTAYEPANGVPGSSLPAQTAPAPVGTYYNLNAVTQFANPSLFGPISGANNLAIPQASPANTAPQFAAAQLPLDGSELSAYPGTANLLPPVLTPSIAARDRKINLNFPLPVSNDPGEPVRQKWVRETYQLFKAILPPQAIDTPQELAQLSQFVVNMVDFRDPDCSMTRFVNTDLQVVPPTATAPAGLVFAIDPVGGGHYRFDPTIYDDTAYRTSLDAAPNHGQFLIQHGMEYQPVAINEVLAYSYQRRTGVDDKATGTATHRFFMELVNTNSDDGSGSSASDLNLQGWDVVIAPDNVDGTDIKGRPDPITGEVPPIALATAGFTSNFGIDLTTKIQAIRTGPQYYILANAFGATDSDNPDPSGTHLITLPGSMSNNPFPTTHTHTPKSGDSRFMWVYLRRPANPFNPSAEKVVVDSMRFTYAEAGGEPAWDMDKEEFTTSSPGKLGTRRMFSTHRFQPFRGGQNAPVITGGSAPIPPTAWGFTEQTAPSTRNGNFIVWKDSKNNSTNVDSQRLHHDLGDDGEDEPWNLFVFHDRDFTSPAEVLLVPGAAPGLFTKQFVENPNPIARRGAGWNDSNLTSMSATPSGSNIGAKLNTTTPSVYPYLPDAFYYSAASVAPSLAAGVNDPYPSTIGGWTGAGWHRLLEFVEVPSSANGAIGPVSEGWNFDWARQDRRPGQINLNLIIDEEVFFGVLDDPRMNTLLMGLENPSFLPKVVSQIDDNGYPVYRATADPAAADPDFTGAYPISTLSTYQLYDPGLNQPLLYDATQPYVVGGPTANGRGFAVQRQLGGKNYVTQGMKAAFSDFLKLRHGGSGFLFAWGTGVTGQGSVSLARPIAPNPTLPVARERPFRSLSNPDINATIMRPATLPPSRFTTPKSPPDSWELTDVNGVNPLPAYPLLPPDQLAGTTPTNTYRYDDLVGNMYVPPNGSNPGEAPSEFVMDPGLKNPYLDRPALNQARVPVIPPRRLFQIPDKEIAASPPSAAAAFDVPLTNGRINQPVNSTYLDYQNNSIQGLSTVAPTLVNNTQLGTLDPAIVSQLPSPPPVTWQLGDAGAADRRQHPYFRTEWLQKVMNLTTVRTHQFAVWITIGFFEVTETGAASLAAPDKLGAELSLAAGRSLRYRSFFILDRTRAVGFNASNPIDFHDVVTYRRRIE
ncbi:MAG: hypothetical protein SFX72_12125 [Isosphaeraceae bacterium]|nr:hypothetical protein [Isosphaeraceae bacterium]